MDYNDALAQTRVAYPSPLAAGSRAESEAIDRFKRFFADFSPARIDELIESTYAERMFFNDTLKTVVYRTRLRQYLQESAAALELCVVDVADVMTNGHGDYYFRWRMRIRFKRFARGRDTTSVGISHIRFDGEGRVVFHQDFWDSANGLFEHVPVLGWMIRAIKRRL